jgi:FAD-dependent urate hydroxylase
MLMDEFGREDIHLAKKMISFVEEGERKNSICRW